MADQVAGETDQMKRFSENVLGSLSAFPVPRTVVREPDPLCDGGMLECGALAAADNRSTAELHRFITHLTQGFAAYSTFVHRSAVAYVQADLAGRQRLLAGLAAQNGQGLPDSSPELERG
ncbi:MULTISPECIES: hypothetical protein [Amycolatopsis]|uniref:hypothetical protein n=1 Tax=Amycolatopsis sp. cg13 TaxID=3238807 RepID=UPI0035232D63